MKRWAIVLVTVLCIIFTGNVYAEENIESQEILNAISEFIIMLKCHKKLTLNGMILKKSEKEKIILQLEKAMKNVIKNCNSI